MADGSPYRDGPHVLRAIDDALADRLREIRKRTGKSQQQVGDELAQEWGLPGGQMKVSRIEAGRQPVTVGEVFALAHVYGVSPFDLWRAVVQTLDIPSPLDEPFLDDHDLRETAKRLATEALRQAIEQRNADG